MKNEEPEEPFDFPKLNILPESAQPPELPRLSTRQKYGSLFWLGISGLVFSIILVSWFVMNLWLMREVWREIYVLHNESLPESRRIEAASQLARLPRVEPSQLQPMIFRRYLPVKARIIIAESLKSPDSVATGREMLRLLFTQGATSPEPWLRRHLARLAATGLPIDKMDTADLFEKLLNDSDPVVADWSAYALFRSDVTKRKESGRKWLESRLAHDPVAEALALAISSDDLSRRIALEQATLATTQAD